MEFTLTEQLFLDTLEKYEKLFPDGEHIDPLDREERLQRTFAWMNRIEVCEMLTKSTDILVQITDVVNGVAKGHVRPIWVSSMQHVIYEFTTVIDLIHEAVELKLH